MLIDGNEANKVSWFKTSKLKHTSVCWEGLKWRLECVRIVKMLRTGARQCEGQLADKIGSADWFITQPSTPHTQYTILTAYNDQSLIITHHYCWSKSMNTNIQTSEYSFRELPLWVKKIKSSKSQAKDESSWLKQKVNWWRR